MFVQYSFVQRREAIMPIELSPSQMVVLGIVGMLVSTFAALSV
jgi:hypothetical protein